MNFLRRFAEERGGTGTRWRGRLAISRFKARAVGGRCGAVATGDRNILDGRGGGGQGLGIHEHHCPTIESEQKS
jgi:hypothetical protein